MSKKKKFTCTSEAQKQAIRRSYAKKAAAARKASPSRTADGRVPQGRTLTTQDNYLSRKETNSRKERPVVVIEANKDNELAVVPLSSRSGRNRTQLKNYQQGQSYFKHFVEVEDNEGKPIRVNDKFRENHPNMDVAQRDVGVIKDKVLYHSTQAADNRAKMKRFRNKKKSP